jgi:hypothetical protein
MADSLALPPTAFGHTLEGILGSTATPRSIPGLRRLCEPLPEDHDLPHLDPAPPRQMEKGTRVFR